MGLILVTLAIGASGLARKAFMTKAASSANEYLRIIRVLRRRQHRWGLVEFRNYRRCYRWNRVD